MKYWLNFGSLLIDMSPTIAQPTGKADLSLNILADMFIEYQPIVQLVLTDTQSKGCANYTRSEKATETNSVE